jgi:hypothetical protein
VLRPAKKWTPELEDLIARFGAVEPASAPFQLAPWGHVVDPVKYHEALRQEIEMGPESPRARLGGLSTELAIYLRIREELTT